MTEVDERAGRTSYRCVVGHEIPAAQLDDLTEIAVLDAGAVVRLCRQHGTPIAITVAPPGAEAGARR